MLRKKCEFCKQEIEKGVKERVEVYGRVGTWKKDFCSEECLERYRKVTVELMKTRRPNVCTRCLR
ncbi:MAG: hypothetical protein GTN37_02635 [Candidatus Aenigmarchaeota archaeon]|nr:hypothetical protein [Candidatus Aenigmarchaeota archaeon]NIQ17880.1 hypothetical protein [Candidatus Aenigmarchaeota archaeon]NIS73300.1 hypothetical protein [Candidatus Aenigmarchaeota archaeon]